MSHQLNIERLTTVSKALGKLNNEVVYVGGATVSLYVTPQQTEEVRPTNDVDVVVELASYGEYASLYDQLITRGFGQSHEDAVICRFRLNRLIVDIMSTQDIGMGSPNQWYADGFKTAIWHNIAPTVSIRILTPAYFLATKFDAYFDRGVQDPYASKDWEDIVFLIDNCLHLQAAVNESATSLRQGLQGYGRQISQHKNLFDIVLGHLSGPKQEERTYRIINFIRNL